MSIGGLNCYALHFMQMQILFTKEVIDKSTTEKGYRRFGKFLPCAMCYFRRRDHQARN